MNTKKFRITAIAVMLGLSVTGCGNSDNSSSEDNSSENTSSISEVSAGTSTTEAETEASQSNNNSNTELSDDLMDFQVSINGKVLTLPCTIKELTDTGCELDTSYTTILSAGVGNHILKYKYADVIFSVRAYNFSDNEYNLEKETDPADVIIPNIMISGDFSTADIVLPKGLNLNDATAENIEKTYGKMDLNNGYGLLTYCGDHNDGNIEWDKKLTAFCHKNDNNKKCEYYVEFCPEDYSPELKSVTLASSEEIVDSFYEKYPEQRK